MIKRICVLYYSATGTTKKVAETLTNTLKAEFASVSIENFDVSLPQNREKEYSFGEGDLLLCGFPVYAGRVPNLLLPFVKGNIKGEGALAIPFVTFGNRNFDDALIELKQALEASGFETVAAGAFSCEHSFSTILGAGRPDAEDLKEVASLAEKAAEKIKSGKIKSFEVTGNPELPAYYTPRDRHGVAINILKVKPKTDESKCVKCGHCVEVCTMGSISKENPSEVAGKCTKCCACVKGCPQGAKYYDDEGYLYHKTELEEMYASNRKENALFY